MKAPSILLLAAVTMPVSAADESWASFSASHSRSRLDVLVTIGTKGVKSLPPVYWFERTVNLPGKPKQIRRVDTEKCPALLDALRSLRTLPMPRLEAPFLDRDEIVITADGVLYELDYPGAYPGKSADRQKLASNVGTPLAEWIEGTLRSIDDCLEKAG